ncbi:ATP-binding cassette domain-containing protein [Kineosporia succinea]|uniref:Lipooligosaccharide transport system ATP-binding protein n=1 Tax=Kineosporia succinea TaxID=84632 RepID=A0ABT9NWJ7_9ACTN|nr:ABC transporter ATP-binding protein [Kineosporia succinea]MDP9824642.1 lipooligosaccharide transport system ATP-binding protein [Kineosporia succinea]
MTGMAGEGPTTGSRTTGTGTTRPPDEQDDLRIVQDADRGANENSQDFDDVLRHAGLPAGTGRHDVVPGPDKAPPASVTDTETAPRRVQKPETKPEPKPGPEPEPEPEPDILISARGLTKHFGDFVAVDGIDLDVRRGEAFGFLGPNGAGKSSTMRMIGCVSPLTDGSLSLFGLDPATDGPAIRGRLGVVPQKDLLDEELTVRENLLVYGRYFGLSRSEVAHRADELLRFAQLSDRADSPVEPLSGGMKRRLTIARALINAPGILLLDEPTTGLDPQARHVLWDRLYRLKQQGVTLVLTTHYMDEAEQLCDRLVVMDHGKIVAEGSPRQLIERYSSREVVELRYPDLELEPHRDRLDLGDLAERVEVLPDRLLIYTQDGDTVSRVVEESDDRPMSVLVRRSSLEDVFLRLTGRTLVD